MKNILTTRSGQDCPADLKQDIKKFFPFLSDSSAAWIDVSILVAPQPPPIMHHVPPFYQPNSADPYYANSASQGFVEHPFTRLNSPISRRPLSLPIPRSTAIMKTSWTSTILGPSIRHPSSRP